MDEDKEGGKLLDLGRGAQRMLKWAGTRQAQREALGGRVIPTGIDFIDDRLLGLMPTDLLLIGAETGAGKTTLASLVAKLAAQRGKRVTVFALEAYDGELSDRFIYQELSQIAWAQQHPGRFRMSFRHWLAGYCEAVNKSHLDEAVERFSQWADNIRVYYREDSFGVDDIRRELLAEKGECDFFVFDHVHYVDTDDANENRALKEITKALRHVVLESQRPIVCVAHLRKRPGFERVHKVVPSVHDFHGSSDLVKIATQVVLLAPARDMDTGPDLAPTYFQLVKDRYNGAGDSWIGIQYFDRRSQQYKPGYALGRLAPDGGSVESAEHGLTPWWAERATWS